MPAQASADTPQLLTINCSSGVVGGPSLGNLTRDIAARCENVRFSLAGHTEKGTPLHKPAYCEPTTERRIGGRRHFRAEHPLLPLDWATREYISGKQWVLGCVEDQHQTHTSPRVSQAAVHQDNQPLKTVSWRW
ncbi:hypothetical protein HaLaN_08510, partial [Haematococcus lacustris]